jgi:hypothetical protein
MASSEAQETINGHVNHAEEEADNSDIRNGEHPAGPVDPVNNSEEGVSKISLGQSAQLEELAVSPVLDDAAPSQPVGQSKGKPAQRAVPTLQTPTVKTAASGPPTPQVKKVYKRFVISLRARYFYSPTLTCTLRIADLKLGQVRYRCHQGCPTPNLQDR